MKVGIIGLGSIARKHLSALQQLAPGTEVVALRHSAANVDTQPGIANLYSVAGLLDAKPDFVIISNPTARHYDTVSALADSGIPLFIEKPLFADLDRPLPAVKGMTYVACNLRFLASLQWVKEHLSGRRVNEVNAYCGSYLPDWRPAMKETWRNCYSANRAMGGGGAYRLDPRDRLPLLALWDTANGTQNISQRIVTEYYSMGLCQLLS